MVRCSIKGLRHPHCCLRWAFSKWPAPAVLPVKGWARHARVGWSAHGPPCRDPFTPGLINACRVRLTVPSRPWCDGAPALLARRSPALLQLFRLRMYLQRDSPMRVAFSEPWVPQCVHIDLIRMIRRSWLRTYTITWVLRALWPSKAEQIHATRCKNGKHPVRTTDYKSQAKPRRGPSKTRTVEETSLRPHCTDADTQSEHCSRGGQP